MRVIERDEGIRAVTDGKTATVTLGEGWAYADDPPEEIGGPAYLLTCREHVAPTADVGLPAGGVAVVEPDGVERRVGRGETEFVAGTETVVAQGAVPTLCRPVAGGTLTVDAAGEPTVETDGPVTLGWITPPDAPVERIVSGREPQSIADTVAAASVSLPSVHSPRRTWPNARAPAPRFVLDGDGPPPAAVDRMDSGVEFHLPATDGLAHTVAVSTLAYYLAGTVTLGDTEEARLHADGTSWSLGDSPEAVDRTASRWLRRIFYLDCLTRCAGPDGVRLREADAALAHVDGDAQTLFDLDIGPRVDRYLAADDAVLDELPRWPEVVHVAPDAQRVPRLARYLGRLADVRLPRGDELTVAELSGWEPDAPVRGQSSSVPTARIVPEAHGEAGVVGWDAPGHPMGAFDACGDPARRDAGDDPLQVVVVRCGWQSPHAALARWRDREQDLELEVEVVSRPTTERLQEVLTRNVDVVHLAAHHEAGSGVECSDGHLQAHELPSVGATALVANCCDAERWARRAVERGAVAAVAPTGPIPVEEAERDGADLAGLLSLGWCVERGVSVLREIYDGAGWVVVGDGTARATVASTLAPPVVSLDTEDGSMSVDWLAPSWVGRRISTVDQESVHLPNSNQYDFSSEAQNSIRDSDRTPIVVDQDHLEWPSYDTV